LQLAGNRSCQLGYPSAATSRDCQSIKAGGARVGTHESCYLNRVRSVQISVILKDQKINRDKTLSREASCGELARGRYGH